ncbi:unnamed protein product [Dibothriocephalus latus]|uniref:Signal peptidase complex catalytic subunit SEC11 n=1 Tax=Dibothriocephalus latus TaxID=60516 RepID=A0A3P7L9L1_DIBLA|nr:unnamed protein product [Dibothriocephalus latus]
MLAAPLQRNNGTVKFLTKGDNNAVDDRGLYASGQDWLERKHVMGRAKGFLPYIGMVTIIMNDYPKFKVGCPLFSLFAYAFHYATSISQPFDLQHNNAIGNMVNDRLLNDPVGEHARPIVPWSL